MTTIAIRKKLVNFFKVADDKKVKAIYTLFEDEIRQNESSNIKQYNNELKEAESEFENRDYVSHETMEKQIKKW